MAKDDYYNLAERLDHLFEEIDSDTCTNLRDNNVEYTKMWRESNKLLDDFTIIKQITETEGEVSLTAEEHRAFARYLSLKNSMENMERKQIYFRGHTDGFAYLKMIGAI